MKYGKRSILYTFPKFKYLVYSKSSELDDLLRINLNAALYVSINFSEDYNSLFDNMWDEFRKYINQRVVARRLYIFG